MKSDWEMIHWKQLQIILFLFFIFIYLFFYTFLEFVSYFFLILFYF